MDDQQQFCLRWNDFQTNMVASFKHLRDEKSFCDVTIACDGQSCKAHKMILSACSPYFKVILACKLWSSIVEKSVYWKIMNYIQWKIPIQWFSRYQQWVFFEAHSIFIWTGTSGRESSQTSHHHSEGCPFPGWWTSFFLVAFCVSLELNILV